MDTKAKQIILYIIFSIMFFVCFIFAYSAKQIHFSHKSGFYDNEFYFSIKSPKNTKIFYTLDSSEPTVNSPIYSKPILIKDASSNPNVFSARSDMTFNNKNTPKSPVDKATILRVCVFDENNNLIKQDYRIFFVGFKNKKGYKNLPIVSVIMNPEDIIGEENGLLILGKKENPKEEDCWEAPVSRINFCAMGRSWERQAIIDIFDQNQKPEELLSIFISYQKDELFFLLDGDLKEINSLCDYWDDRIRVFTILNGKSKAIHKLKYNIVQLIVYSGDTPDKNREGNLLISRKIIIKGDMTDKEQIVIDDDEVIELPFHMIPTDEFASDEEQMKRLSQLLPEDEDLLALMEKQQKRVNRKEKEGVQNAEREL